MQVKTQKQIEKLQIEAKNIASTLNKEVIIVVKGVQHVQVQAGTAYQLNFQDFDTKKTNLIAKKIGDDLEVTLEDDVIIFDNYFNICAPDLSCLVSLPTESGELYHIVPNVFFNLEDGTQVVYFYGEQSAIVGAGGQSFYDIVTSNIGAGVTVLLGTIAIIASSGDNDNDSDNIKTTITGTVSVGKYISGGANNPVEVYKADGTLIGSSALSENGQYTVTLTGDNANYTGAVYIKLTKSGIYHADELKGREVLDSDLFAIAYIHSGENIVDISVRSSIAAKILGVDETTTTIALSKADIDKWNEKVNASFDLSGSAIDTDVDTINSLGDESDVQAQHAGQVAAALSGMRNTPATNTFEKVIEKMADIIASTGALNKTAFDALIIGAIAVKAKAEADKVITEADVDNAEKALKTAQDAVDAAGDNATTAQKQALDAAQKAYDQAVAKNLEAQNFIKMAIETIDHFNGLQIAVSDITITSDTGAADFITNDNTLVIGATLDDALPGSKKLWGSIDGGKTWTDISVANTNVVWSNNNKTVAWTQTLTKDTSSSIQFIITKTITATTATVAEIMADKDGGIASHDYTYDSTAPTEATIAIKSDKNNLVGAGKIAHLDVAYDNMAVGDVIQLQKGGDNKTDLGSIYTVTSLDVENGKATIAIQQTDLSVSSANNILVSVKSITDLAGNVNNTASANQVFEVDVVAPVITAFSAVSGAYKEGAEISLTATVSKSIKAGTKITITLDTGAIVELTATVEGTTLTGTYTVEASQNSNNLSVRSFTIDDSMPPTDTAGNAIISTTIIHNITAGVIIDNTAPVFTSGAEGIGVVNQDIAVYDAKVSNGDNTVEYTIDNDKFNIDKDTGVVTYKATPTEITTEADSITITATDAAGNSTQHSVSITIANKPVITITSDKPDGTNGAFTLTFSFTEAVNGFELTNIDFGDADANLIKGTLTPTTANKVFTLTVTPKDALENSNIAVNIAAGVVTSQASKQSNIAAFEFIQKFDEISPEVSITSSALTNDTTPEISGTAEMGTTIKVTVAGATYTTTAATDGNWSIDTDTTPNSGTLALTADNAVTVIATDAAGNTTEVTHTLKIDTTAPSLTTQANTTLSSKSDLMISFNENIKTQGGNVEIWNANGKVETITINNSNINGNILTVHPINDLPEGSFYLTMASGVITDMAGNNAAAITKNSNQWAFEVKALSTSINLTGTSDTDAYINASEKSNAVLSGELISDNATIDEIRFYTVAENGALMLALNLTIDNVTIDSNRRWSQSLSDMNFVDGTIYKVEIHLRDGDTKVKQYSNAVTFDTSPATLTINAVSTDDKINLSDKNASIVISGTSDAIGQTVAVSWDNGTEKTVVVDDNGDWSLTYTANEVPADNATSKITARVSDVAGNPETLIEHSIIIDTVATAKPVIGFATGEDKYINATETSVNLEISSTEMVAGDTIQLKKDGVNFNAAHTVTTIEVNAGKATINIAKSDLGSNDNTVEITAVITDVTGNTSAISDVQNIVLDAINPTLTDVMLVGDANKTAAEAMANVLSFTAETGSTVEVVFTGTNGTITRNIASASGTAESIALVANDLTTLGEGAISVQTTVTDKAGNTTISNAGNFVLDTQGPTAPENLNLATEDDTGNNNHDNLTKKTSGLIISGTTEVNATIELFNGSTSLGTATADNNGHFSHAIDLSANSTHNITARATDVAGNISDISSNLAITIDTVGSSATLNTTVTTKNTGNISVQSSETGTAYLVHSSITVDANTTQANLDAFALADKVNKVTIATVDTATDLAATGLVDGEYKVYTVDIAGNISTASAGTVTIDTTNPSAPTGLSLADSSNTGSNDDNITSQTSALTLSGTAEANATVELFNGATSLGTVTADNGGNFSKDIDLSADTTHNITAKATDTAGNTSDASAVLAITVDTVAPTMTTNTTGQIASSSDLVAIFSEAIAKGTGDIVIKESSDGTVFETLSILGNNITIGGADNRTLTINPSKELESNKSYYIEIAAGVLTDVAGNDFAGISNATDWTFSAASLSTTVVWSGTDVDATDSYINANELAAATITGKITNQSNASDVSIAEIKFISGNGGTQHIVSDALKNAISIDTDGNWTLVNDASWTSALDGDKAYIVQVTLSGTLSGNAMNGLGQTSSVTIDNTITATLAGTHAVIISNDTGILDNDRITNDSVVKVSLTLENAFTLANDETLQVSADGTNWVATTNTDTNTNIAWATADDAVTLVTGANTLTARVIDTAGNVTVLALSDNDYTLDTVGSSATLNTTVATKNTGNISVQSSETGTAYLVHSSITVDANTTQANLDAFALADKVNKVTIATVDTATDLAATGLVDGEYKVYTVDIAGNISTASTGTVTIDTTNPSAPIGLSLADSNNTGSNDDNITNQTSALTLSGTAEANATVELFNGATSLGTVTADNGGNFSKDVDLSADTTHNITAKATDTAGNTSDASAILAITVDTVAPTMTTNTTGQIASSSDLVAIFSEAIAKGTGDIVIKESGDGTVFETLSILGNNITIGGADNRTLTINPSADLESNKSYYIEIAAGVLTDVAGNDFAGISNATDWTFSAASLSTTVVWSGIDVDTTDSYINANELAAATITGKITNQSNASNVSIAEIKFVSGNGGAQHIVGDALKNAISIDTDGNWTLVNDASWTSALDGDKAYIVQVTLSGTLSGNAMNGLGQTSSVTIDNTITATLAGTHTVTISNDTGILDNDRITNDSAVKVSLTLASALTLSADEALQVSADGTNWVATTNTDTNTNTAWATADDAVTLVTGSNTLTARVIDTAGNVTVLALSDNDYTLDTVGSSATLNTTVTTKNTGNISVQSSEIGTAYLVHSSITVDANTTQANLDAFALADKVNKVTIATVDTATDLAATGLVDGEYKVYTVDIAGNISTASAGAVTIDTTNPSVPTGLSLADSSNTGSNDDNITSQTSALTLSGTAEANATVELFNGATSLGTVTADNSGNFSKDIDLSADTTHNITAKATDTAGNTSDASAVLAITVDTVAPTMTTNTTGQIASSSDLVAIFSEAIAKGTGDIVIKESSDGTVFETLSILGNNITIGGADNRTLTINPSKELESNKSYYIEIAAGVLTDVAGNDFAGISNATDWTFSAASLSTTVVWSGTDVDATDSYINANELAAATITGKITNQSNASDVSIAEIKFISGNGGTQHIVSDALKNAISIDTDGNWTLVNDASWTSALDGDKAYIVQVTLSGTLSGNAMNGLGQTSSVTIDNTITATLAGTHAVIISNDTGILDNDRITNDSVVKVSLTLENAFTLANDETLQVSADGTNWVATTNTDTNTNIAWATADDAVTLVTGANTLTARVIDTAGNVTVLALSDNDYTLDTVGSSATLNTTVATKNTGNISVQSSETGTAYLVHSSITVDANTTQANLDAFALADKVNKVTIATVDTATDLAATGLVDGEYKVYTVDIAGNISTASTGTVTIDTTNPSAPIGLSLADSNNTGSNDDNITNQTSALTLSGTAEANATVELFNGATSLGTVTADNGGNFSKDVDLSADTTHNITAKATDTAGNTSDASAILAITVDTVAPTMTTNTTGQIASSSDLVAIFSEAIAKGTGDIVIKESGDGTVFETLSILGNNITIGGADNRTLTINPSADLESNKSYYIEIAAGVLTDVAGNDFAGISNATDWTFSAASLSTTVVWSGIDVDTTDSYINANELAAATITGKITNQSNASNVSIAEIKFVSGNGGAQHIVGDALKNAISIDTDGNWTLVNDASWTSALDGDKAYIVQVTLSGTLSGNAMNGLGQTSSVTIDNTITATLAGTHTVTISNDTGILDNDRITNDSAVKVSLTLASALTLSADEALQVSADGTNWVATTNTDTNTNTAWATADDAVTLVTGSNTLTARVIDTAGNVTVLALSDNDYTLDTVGSSATLNTTVTTKNTGNISVQSSEIGTAYLVHSSITVDANTTQANLDAFALADKVNKVTIATVDTATDLAATGLVDGEYKVYTVDIAGNISTASAGAVTIDTTNPSVPTGLSLADSSNTGSNDDNITSQTSALTLSGTAEANATVELFNGATSLGTVTADNSGNFSKDIDLSADTTHNITAKATDTAGNTSDASAVLAITVDTVAPTMTTNTTGQIASSSDLVAIFSEAIAKGTGDIVIKESGGTVFETLSILGNNITIGGADNRTLTINPSADLEPNKSYYIEIAAGVLTDVAGNDFAGISNATDWTFSAASLSTTVVWSGTDVDATDSYINANELAAATIAGKITNQSNASDVSIAEIKFISGNGGTQHIISDALKNAISIDTDGNWTLVNDASWTSALDGDKAYIVQVTLSGTLSGNAMNGLGQTSSVTIDNTITATLAGTHAVIISNDTGILDNDRITNDSVVKVSLTLENAFTLANDETLQVSADGTNWVATTNTDTNTNTAWATADDAVTLVTGANTLTARVIDTAGNVTVLALSDNDYTLDTVGSSATLNTTVTTKNTGNISVQSSEIGTAYLVHSSITVDANTTQANLDAFALADKVNKVTIATVDTATDLAATGLVDGEYKVYTVDIAGNISTASAGAVTIDTTNPSVPTGLSLADSSNTGSNDDNITSQTSALTLSGTAEANATVELFNGATSLGTVTADNSGNFSKDVDLSADTTHNITAKATDTAGNTSDASAVLAITVDTVAPTMTTNTTGQIASSSDLVAIFSEAIAKGTGDIVIKESGGTAFETLSILGNNITIGGVDNRTLTINPSADLEPNKSYYIEIAAGVLTDVAGNDFAGISNATDWTFSAASLSTTVVWSGTDVDATDSYINANELAAATITGKITNQSNASDVSIAEIKFISDNGGTQHIISDALKNAISIDTDGNWTLVNDTSWTSALDGDKAYIVQVTLSGTLSGNAMNGLGQTSSVTIDNTITATLAGTHTVTISNDTGILDNDRITNDSAVKVSLTLASALTLSADEALQVSADGTNWIATTNTDTNTNTAWATADDAVTLVTGSNTLTARVIDTAGNITVLALSDNDYTLDTVGSSATLNTTVTTKNTGNISVQSSETGTAYLVHSSITVDANTTQANLDAFALADKVNKVTITTVDTATDLAATGLVDGEYKVYTVDIAGNISTASTGTVTIDTTNPSVPAGLSLADSSNTGSNDDNITSQTSALTLSGTAEANATVELFNGATSLGTVTADNSGNFSKNVDLSADTTHNITAKATDTAGNTSDASAVLAITVDTVAPTMTTNTTGQIASSSDLVATFSEAIAKGTGDIVIKESSDGTVFETLSILGNNITIGGVDNRTLTINPSADLESNKSYYIEIAAGVLTDVAGNDFAGINNATDWTFSAASLSTAVVWSGTDVDVTDGYINANELAAATITGKIKNQSNASDVSITEIKFISGNGGAQHIVSDALKNAISIDTDGNWTLVNDASWTSALDSDKTYIVQVALSGTLLGNVVNGLGQTLSVIIDNTIVGTLAGTLAGTHTVTISNDTGILDNDRITNDSAVKVSLTLVSALTLSADEALQVSADGTNWIATTNTDTNTNTAWATADDAVTLVAGASTTLTARVIDTAGNVTVLALSDNDYTLDTVGSSATLNTTVTTKNTGNISVQSSEIGTAYLVHSSITVDANTTQANLDAFALADKVNKVTIATVDTATDLAATGLVDGEYKVYTVDIAGNISTASAGAVTIDTTNPSVPTGLSLADSSNTGSNDDNITSQTSALTLSGTAEANATVELFNGATSLGTVTADNSGNFSKDIDLSADTTHNITAKATDTAGNTSDASAVLAITVDTVAPTMTTNTTGQIVSSSDLVAIFSEAIAKGTGDIVIKESGGTVFETLSILGNNITIGGVDNRTLTINPSADLESNKSYYIEIAAGVLTDVAGNDFAGISNATDWTFSAASLSTTVVWSGTDVDATDSYINANELAAATITGKVTNQSNASNVSIAEIKFVSGNGGAQHIVGDALKNAISIDTDGNWTLVNDASWTSALDGDKAYIVQVTLSGTLSGNAMNGSGQTSSVTIDNTITATLAGTHTVTISNDTGILDNDRITNDSAVKVSLTLASALTLSADEALQVSADGANWVATTNTDTNTNTAWATADDAVTLATGANTLTARVIDTAGNVTVLALSDNDYTLDTVGSSATLNTTVTTKNTGNISVQSSETGTAYLVHSSITVDANTTQANLDAFALADKVNKVTIATVDTATDLAATGLVDGEYKVYTVDIAGNISTASTGTVTIDTTNPSVPAGLSLADSSNTGSNDDNITSQTSALTLSGTAEANATVELFNGATSLGTVTADNSGNFSKNVDLSADTTHNITAKATDTAGNTSDASAVLAITVDTVAPTMTTNTTGQIASSSDLVATFSEAIAKGTGDIVIKESSDGTVFETLSILGNNVTIGGADNRTLTINPSADLEPNKSYYIEIAAGVLTDVAGNDFAGISNATDWTFSAASLSTTVVWSGTDVDATDSYINANELAVATITGKITNQSNASDVSIAEIKFISGNGGAQHIVSDALKNAISIDTDGNWTLVNDASWTSALDGDKAYIVQVTLSGTLLGNAMSGLSQASIVIIDDTITSTLAGAHTVAISNDAGTLGNDRITNDSAVKVSLTLENALTLANDEMLQVSADGTNWVATTNTDTNTNTAWATADDAVILITGAGKTLTARIIDTAGNATILDLTNNSYLLDTSVSSTPLGTHLVAISNDTGVLDDRITSDSVVKVSLTLANALILASDEMLQVSANGVTWVEATNTNTTTNTAWATADDAVTLITGTGKTLTARIIDTAGNVTTLPLSDNSYTLDTTQATITSVVINGKKRGDGQLFTGSGIATDPNFVFNETKSILRVRDEIIVKVTMSEVVHLTTTDASNPATYTIKIDGVDKVATYVSGSGSNALIFSYAVEDNINTTNITSPVNALSLGADILKNAIGNNTDLTISAPNITVTDITIDNTPSVINAEATKILDSADGIKVKSSENGTAYLIQYQISTFVSSGSILTYKQKLDQVVTIADPDGIPYGVKIDVLADTFADLSISQLKTGERYKLLFLDEAGNFVGSEVDDLLIIIGGNTLSHDIGNINYGLSEYQNDAEVSNFIGGIGADTITGNADIDTIAGGAGADVITGGAGADVFNYNVVADSTKDNADTITDFEVAIDKLNLKDIITTGTNGNITDAASLAKYIYAEADAGADTNVKLYIKSDGVSTGTVSDSNADMLINLTVVDATAQSALVAALADNNLGEYILS